MMLRIFPYVFDLVRLATACGSMPSQALTFPCDPKGYRNGPAKPGPTLLDENETWMRQVACSDDDRANFCDGDRRAAAASRRD